MKRYIKATVIQDIYLKDWIESHRDNHPSKIVIDDRTPYTGDWEDFNGESYIDCPGPVFIGTYDELLSGRGDNLLFECEGNMEDYWKRISSYYISDIETVEPSGMPPETWIAVFSE